MINRLIKVDIIALTSFLTFLVRVSRINIFNIDIVFLFVIEKFKSQFRYLLELLRCLVLCDLLAACFSSEHRAPRTLYKFMCKSIERGDVDDWGVGFFLSNKRAVVVKDADIEIEEQDINTAFKLVINCVESEIILVHFRLASRRELYGPKYAHPFKDELLMNEWIFAHNGYSESILDYKTPRYRLHEDPRFDSPRIFEFLRDRMIEYSEEYKTGSLYGAVRYAVNRLYEEYGDGTYNFVLADSNVLFVNLDGEHSHNNRLYLLYRKKDPPHELTDFVSLVPWVLFCDFVGLVL